MSPSKKRLLINEIKLKTMSRSIILLGLFAAISTGLYAQQGDTLSKQVTVTRSFEGAIPDATKYPFTPDAEDISVEPDQMEYSISPTVASYDRELSPLAWQESAISRDFDERLISAKAALGLPMQSLLDLYYGVRLPSNLVVGAAFNHYGYYGKLTNLADVKESAGMNQNRLSAFGNYSGKVDASLRLGYGYNSYNRYGYLSPTSTRVMSTPLDETLEQHYNMFDVNFALSLPKKSNGIQASVAVDMQTARDITGMGDIATSLTFDGEIPFGDESRSSVVASIGVNNVTRNDKFDDTFSDDNSAVVGIAYEHRGQKVDMSIGVEYVQAWSGISSFYHDNAYLIPAFDFQFIGFGESFIPYITLESDYVVNSISNLSKLNPYIYGTLAAPASLQSYLSLGVKGSSKSRIAYNIYIGMQAIENQIHFINSGYGNTFDIAWEDAGAFTAGLQLDYDISSSFAIGGKWNFVNYEEVSVVNGDYLSGLSAVPSHTGQIALKYRSHLPYSIALEADFVGNRSCVERVVAQQDGYFVREIGAKTDISLVGDYVYDRNFTFFAQLNNIFNQELYQYNLYRGIGFNVMVGAKVNF